MQAKDLRDGIIITGVEILSFTLARNFLLRSLSPTLKDASESKSNEEDDEEPHAPLLPTLRSTLSKPLIPFIKSKLSAVASLNHVASGLIVSRWAFSMVFAQASKIIFIAILNAVNVLHTPAVQVAFKISLTLLLLFVITLIPYLQCFLFVRLRQASTTVLDYHPPLLRTIKISLIPFAAYALLFSTIPLPLSNASNLFGKALVRSVGLGVIILAVLSGFSVVSTTFMFLQAVSKRNWLPVSLDDIDNSEKALLHVQTQLDDVRAKVHSAQVAATAKMEENAPNSVLPAWMTSWTRSDVPGPMRTELSALTSLEEQMRTDLADLRFKCERQEFSRTLKGKAYMVLGYTFAVYCITRVVLSLFSLMFRQGHTESTPDYFSLLLGKVLARVFGARESENVYSKQVSVVSIGAIIVSNTKALLLVVRRIFKKVAGTTNVALNEDNSGSTKIFLIFLLAQLMGSFFLTMLVQLNSSLSTSTNFSILADMLPAVDLFGTAFDAPFVISVALTTIIKKL
ncbi:hypothetical protein E3P99_03743 [Wallemia hederae]|uniref:Abscisic acid G-protein coupled receptor-like domain-containing protein n=1 Tax=Wallemia hederae TaxID=1540922 RepID=A0A4T0FFV9_9BASI|nr:hypothetical protein E3P99_03743 [Wallemia hederae]